MARLVTTREGTTLLVGDDKPLGELGFDCRSKFFLGFILDVFPDVFSGHFLHD